MSKDKNKGAILAAANAVFASKGVANTTIEDIAKEAKTDAKAVKALFGSVEDIVDALISIDIEESTELFTRVINDRGKADIKLTRLVRELVQRYEKSYPMVQLISIGLESGDPDDELLRKRLRPEHIERYRQNTAIIGRLIAQGQSENLFTDVDPLEAAYVLRGMISAAMRFRRYAAAEDDVRDHADVIMRIFLKGLLR